MLGFGKCVDRCFVLGASAAVLWTTFTGGGS